MKRVSGRSRLMLRCHDTTNIRRKERKKERETIRRVPNNRYRECMNM